MAKSKENIFDDIYEVVRLIPHGRVTNYGAIAKYLGGGGARMVGWALNQLKKTNDVPAHRVVNRLGELSGRMMFPSPIEMQKRLEKEGIKVENDKVVEFKKLFWHPEELDKL